MDFSVLFQAEIEADDLAVNAGQDRVPQRLDLRQQVPDPGSLLNRENDPVDLDVHLIDP
jgi:hypothetical protein